MSEDSEKKGAKEKVSDGIRQGIGVLSAFKDALEETIQEARERGDLSSDRAKEVMKQAMGKAQSAAEGARERLDFVNQLEFEDMMSQLRGRLDRLEAHVFGSSEADTEDAGADEQDGG
jgi:polyhydroxyalkanoate synthesis regulator phasin